MYKKDTNLILRYFNSGGTVSNYKINDIIESDSYVTINVDKLFD